MLIHLNVEGNNDHDSVGIIDKGGNGFTDNEVEDDTDDNDS